jgi:subtilase family serine protease
MSAKTGQFDMLSAPRQKAISYQVSMSWGGAEFPGETGWDGHFAHPGTVYVAGSGDIGGQTIYPSVSQYVLSAGGTGVYIDEHGNHFGVGEYA